VLGTLEYFALIGRCQVRAEHQQAGEMQLAAGHGVEQRGERFDETRRAGATKGCVFGETQLIDAVRVKASAGLGPMNAPRLDLGEVRQQICEQLVRRTDQATGAGEHLTVRKLRKVVSIEWRVTLGNRTDRHGSSVHLGFSCPQETHARDCTPLAG